MITKKMLEDAFTAGYNYKTNISKKHPHPDRETYIASKVSETHDLVDDGQEGKGLEKAITEIEQRKRDAVNTAGFDDKLAAGEIYAYGEALAIIKKHLAALPVADGENEKK